MKVRYEPKSKMSMPSKVNKENFRLLDLSSDEESEDLQLEIIPSRKKKVTRRERSRGPVTQAQEPNIGAEVQCALRWAVRGTLLLWLLMLTWICAALYDQMSTMRAEIIQVSRSSNSVDDALQICHTTAKEFKANSSDLSSRLAKLEQDYQKLADSVRNATDDLSKISEQLSAAPKLADTPRTIADLKRLVGELGAQITGFEGTVQSNTKQAHLAAAGVEEVRTMLHQLEARTNDTITNVTANVKRDDDIRTDIAALNNTLSAKVDELQHRILEISRPTSTLAPTPVVPAATPSTAAVVNITSTTTPTPPPAKPAVLE